MCLTLIYSCDRIKSRNDEFKNNIEEKMQEVEAAAQDKVVEPVVPDVPLGFLVTLEGKYATRENLFDNLEIRSRLQQLNGFNYEALLENYNTETPIVIIDQIVHMSGCKQHDCPSNAYDFFFDLDNDNINVYHFRSNMMRLYQEKGIIQLPEEFAKEMETKKSNAGIGDPESVESHYQLE